MTTQPTIIVHGGAGRIPKAKLPQMRAGCRQAASIGWEALAQGKSALHAVECAITALEDNPLFNAGTGSTLNSLGEVEMDAAIMDGSSLAVGAVAAVKGIKNPIQLARKVLDDQRHILLVGEGALRFARHAGISTCPPETLIVPEQKRRWAEKHGTVGCVARDQAGKLAAGTSTGGIFDKLPGRVGDSPLPGCGTYADDTAAASCTGNGEAIIRKPAASFERGHADLVTPSLQGRGSCSCPAGQRWVRAGYFAGLFSTEATIGLAGVLPVCCPESRRFVYSANVKCMFPGTSRNGSDETRTFALPPSRSQEGARRTATMIHDSPGLNRSVFYPVTSALRR